MIDRGRAVAVILSAHEAPFAWGVSDCFTFVLDVVEAVTGSAPYADERGQYSSRFGAARRIADRGFGGLDDAFAAVWPVIAPGAALLGDVGLIRPSDGPTAVVFDGTRWIGRAQGVGVQPVPIDLVRRAYRIA